MLVLEVIIPAVVSTR